MKFCYHVRSALHKIVSQRQVSRSSVALFCVLVILTALQIDNFISYTNRRYRRGTMDGNDTGDIQRNYAWRPRGKACSRYPPKAIVIGVTKCGTGPLRMFLNAHPDIDNAPVRVPGGPNKAVSYFDMHYKEGLAWYLSQMPCSGPDRMTIDHTPQYFRKEIVPKRIFMFNSTIKFILMVREPISRAVSQYMQSRETYKGDNFGDFDSFVLDKSRTKVDSENFAVSASSYYVHLQKWFDVFPLSQFQIIDLYDLAKNPLKPLKELERFLGVSSYFDSDNVYFNETRGFHCVKVYGKPGKYLCGVSKSKGQERPQVTDTTYNLLKDYFDPLNEQFFESIEKEFNWTTTKRSNPFAGR